MPGIRFSGVGEIMSDRLDMTAMYAMHNALFLPPPGAPPRSSDFPRRYHDV
jgi:hypothetical protein